MAQNDYLNVQSMAPPIGWQPEGFLGGVMWNRREQDYQRMLAQTEEQRRMAMERQRQEQTEFIRGIPGRNQIQDNATSAAQAMGPLAGPQAAGTAQADIAKNQSFINMIPTQEARTKFDLERDQSVEALRKKQAENQMAVNLLSTAMQMGPVEGLGFMQDQASQLGKGGYNLPRHYLDPNQWKNAYSGAVNSVQQTQEMLKQAERLKSEEWRTDRSARATENAAAIRERSSGSKQRLPRTFDEAVVYYNHIINNPDPEVTPAQRDYAKEMLKTVATREWQKYETSSGNTELQTLRYKASNTNLPASQREKASQEYLQRQNNYFRSRNVENPFTNSSQTAAERNRSNPQPGTSTVPPPPTGFTIR